MSFVPYVAVWVLLLLAGGASLAAVRRPRLLQTLALAAPLLAGLLWFIPWLLSRPGEAVASLNLASWQWAMSATAWQLGGAALALLLAAILHILRRRDQTRDHAAPPAQALALIFGLAAAALLVVWAAEARSLVMGLALLAVVWLAARRFVTPASPAALLWAALPWLAALSLLWFAALVPAARPVAALLAALPLLGLWPAGRRNPPPRDAGLALLLDGAPILAGATVLAAGLPGLSDAGAMLGTALGLLSILAGVSLAWGEPSVERLATPARRVSVGLLLAGAVWVGGEVIPTGARLAVFAPALLALAGALPTVAARIGPRRVALALVFAASAGLPFLVGFPILTGLYGAWGSGAGWALVFVLAALLSLWLAAVAAAVRAAGMGPAVDARAGWLSVVAALPLALGLLHVDAAALSGVRPLVWAALALPPLVGFLLGRFAPLDAVGGLLRDSAAVRLPVAPLNARLRALGQLLGGAFADAAAILEGENGLLLLLALLLLLLWIA
jgi:hypothetical protein